MTAIRLCLGLVLFAQCALLGGCRPRTGARTVAPSVYVASGPGASRYISEAPSGSALRGPHASHVAQGIAHAEKSGLQLTADPRLTELARLVSDHEEKHGALPPGAAIDLWARHLGLWEPTPALSLIKHGDPDALSAHIGSDLVAAHKTQRFTHYGAYTRQDGPAAVAVVALSWRSAQLAPIVRTLSEGRALALRGELLGALRDPVLIIAHPDGQSTRVSGEHGQQVAFEMPALARGEHQVELLASSEQGPTVVANFPVYVGVPARTQTLAHHDDSSGGANTASDVKVQLLELINADRARARLPALAPQPALDRIALAHSEDMRDAGFVGHTSKTTGTAAQRVQRAGLRPGLLLENVGRGYGAQGVHRGLMDSPGHRQNILHRDATHVGIGVVEVAEGDGTAYLVTQLFTRVPSRIEPANAVRELGELVAQHRARAGVRAARLDPELSALCGDAANAFFDSDVEQKPLIEALSRKAASKRLPYKQLSAMMLIASSIEQASEVQALIDAGVQGIGIGVAQGTRPDTIENAIAVVVLLGY